MNVLDTEPRIRLVEPDRSEVDPLPKVNELLNVLPARRGRRILSEFEYKIENRSDVFGEIGDVLVK